jgi:hypothetical protein
MVASAIQREELFFSVRSALHLNSFSLSSHPSSCMHSHIYNSQKHDQLFHTSITIMQHIIIYLMHALIIQVPNYFSFAFDLSSTKSKLACFSFCLLSDQTSHAHNYSFFSNAQLIPMHIYCTHSLSATIIHMHINYYGCSN